MAKRIIVCCDGTWNSPDETERGIPTPTNVARLAEAISAQDAAGLRQQVYYDTGVGTAGGKLRRIFEGGTGSGLSTNVRQAYRYLIQHYEPGDQLFLLGFSRGAFTVRSLAGLIRNCGVLQREFADRVDTAWEIYRAGTPEKHPRERESTLFRRTYAHLDRTPIEFIGVWDTVGALGNPLLLNGIISRASRFHDTDLSSIVRHAYQALAIDELRRHFPATLWTQPEPVPGQVLEQRWFVGVHSDVGGGYAETGLSDIAFGWLLERARSCGLAHEAIALRPDPAQPPHRSRDGLYRALPPYPRRIGAPNPRGATNEVIDPSALTRYGADPRYRPAALVDYFKRNPEAKP